MDERRHEASGLTTIEIVIAVALFGFVLLGLVGLHLVALSAGTMAETSSVATNLARAKMEELLAGPADKLLEQNDTEQRLQVPRGVGRVYLVHTTVAAVDPAQVDVAVTVSWQLTFGTACAAGPAGSCAGIPGSYTRTLRTRVQAPTQP